MTGKHKSEGSPTAAIGHMPFKGHRTCAELFHRPYFRAAQHVVEPQSGCVPVEPRNKALSDYERWLAGKDDRLVGRWAR